MRVEYRHLSETTKARTINGNIQEWLVLHDNTVVAVVKGDDNKFYIAGIKDLMALK